MNSEAEFVPLAPLAIEPTDAMLAVAREWSRAKYGKPIGDDAARGCWQAMMRAAAADENATILIYGIRYQLGIFKTLALGPIGSKFEIFQRSDDVLVLRSILEAEQMNSDDTTGMASHKPMPVAGYSPQSQANVDAVNRNERLEEEVLRAIDELQTTSADARWLAIARTDIEKGFMALNRAIFQPKRLP
jgi:hypothetical protein